MASKKIHEHEHEQKPGGCSSEQQGGTPPSGPVASETETETETAVGSSTGTEPSPPKKPQSQPQPQPQPQTQNPHRKPKRKHPLKMPLRTSPATNRIICRFHNYDARHGCKKHNHRTHPQNSGGEKACGGTQVPENDAAASCPLDHETCHVCLETGHPAHECVHLDNPSSEVWTAFCRLTLKNTRPEDYPPHKTVLGDPIVWIGDAYGCGSTGTRRTLEAPPLEGFEEGRDDLLLRCGAQKKIEAAYLLGLPLGSVVVDAGAHLGDTVLTLALFARARGRNDLRFWAVEPCPEKCSFLETAAAANRLGDALGVVCAALGEVPGEAEPAPNSKDRALREGSLRYVYRRNSGPETGARKNEPGGAPSADQDDNENDNKNDNENDNHNECPNPPAPTEPSRSSGQGTRVITLDSMFDRLTPLGMLHIDVEGWEASVLRGGTRLLASALSGNNDDDGESPPSCVVIAEAWTEKECLRRGVSGTNPEASIARVMEVELPEYHLQQQQQQQEQQRHGAELQPGFEFVRADDIVDVERNLVYVRKKKGMRAS